MVRTILAVTMLATCCACGTTRATAGKELFDEQTGNTLTVASKPVVFARERTDVAAHARDYATLVAVEVDHSGAFKDYLLLYRWSTVDARMLPKPDPAAGRLRLVSEGRELDLTPLDAPPVSAQGEAMHLPKHGAALVYAYAVDLATLRFIAASRQLSLQMPQESLDTPFALWDDGRAALDQFVRQTSAP
jgi:hypothetical protein